MACAATQEESWIPTALQTRLLAAASSDISIPPDVRNWLSFLRKTVDDYEDRPHKQDLHKELSDSTTTQELHKGLSDSDLSANSFEFIDLDKNKSQDVTSEINEDDDVYTAVFDDILSNLGNEIDQLESYHKKYFPNTRSSSNSSEFEQNIMHVFDDFLEEVRSSTPGLDSNSLKEQTAEEKQNMDLKVPIINKIPSYGNLSTLSDEVFLKSESSSRNASSTNISDQSKEFEDIVIRTFSSKSDQTKHASFDINRIFDKGGGAPVPPKRKNRQSTPIPMERSIKPIPKPRNLSKVEQIRAKFDKNSEIAQRLLPMPVHGVYRRRKTSSDSGNNSPVSDYSDYQNLWNCTSGRKIQLNNEGFKENYGTINLIRYDSFKEIPKTTPDIARQRIVVCGPHTRVSSKSGSVSSTRSDRGVESEGAPTRSHLDGGDKNKRYSYDSRKRDEHRIKSTRLLNADMVRCTSECDITDECHRSLSSYGVQNEEMKTGREDSSVNRFSTFKVPTKVINSATVPRVREHGGRGFIRNVVQSDCASNCADSGSVCGVEYANTTATTTTEEDWESSVEILSDSDSFRARNEGNRTASESTDYASESPIYENLRDVLKMPPVPDDVIAWKALLMDPFWIEDEEDEWVTHEASQRYQEERQPQPKGSPTIIPRVVNRNDAFYENNEERRNVFLQRENIERKVKDTQSPPQTTGTPKHKQMSDFERKKHAVEQSFEKHNQRDLQVYADGSQGKRQSYSNSLEKPPSVKSSPKLLPKAIMVMKDEQGNKEKYDAEMFSDKLEARKKDKDMLVLKLPYLHLIERKKKKVYIIEKTDTQQRCFTTEHPTVEEAKMWEAAIKKDYGDQQDMSQMKDRKKSSSKTDHTVFGRELKDVCVLTENGWEQPFVKRCIYLIENNEKNLITDGIYRASGNISQVQAIKIKADKNQLDSIDENVDVHVLTGALKMFFRELKYPLIPVDNFMEALEASSANQDVRIEKYRELVRKLPDCNLHVLKCILRHLRKVTDYKDKNRMHSSNLSIVLGPTLLWAPDNASHDMAVDFIRQNLFIEHLLNHYKEIFNES